MRPGASLHRSTWGAATLPWPGQQGQSTARFHLWEYPEHREEAPAAGVPVVLPPQDTGSRSHASSEPPSPLRPERQSGFNTRRGDYGAAKLASMGLLAVPIHPSVTARSYPLPFVSGFPVFFLFDPEDSSLNPN